jgi:hypothetical protein
MREIKRNWRKYKHNIEELLFFHYFSHFIYGGVFIMEVKMWLDSDEVLNSYKENEECFTVDVFTQLVNPAMIIGLSRELDDYKLERLRNMIQEKGWIDVEPRTINLIKLPTGKYIVSNEGNHRSFLSKELLIPQIKAQVSLLILKKDLTQKLSDEFLSLEQRIYDADEKYQLEDDEIKSKILLNNINELSIKRTGLALSIYK